MTPTFRRSRVVAVAAGIALLVGGCTEPPAEPDSPSPPRTTPAPAPPDDVVRITTGAGTVEVFVEVADSAAEREVGLMGRPSLPPDRGMVFLYEEPVEAAFWMKDTLIPLSIAFWDERGAILAILDMQPCEADPCPIYDPEVAFLGAIEVNLGFFEEHGVGRGDRIELERAG